MLRWLLRRRLAAFERANGYDMAYARDILEADPGALLAFSKVVGLAHYRRGLPRDAWYAAKLAATVAEDCGPCTQLAITMGERDGVPPDVLRAALTGDADALPEEAALAFRFARASLARAPEADALRDQVVGRWGPEALVSIAFTLAAARVFPTVKYALGHGRSCTLVRVGGATVPVGPGAVA